jgi:hypothetical protein
MFYVRRRVALDRLLACADDGSPTVVGIHGRTIVMSISPVGSTAIYAPQVRSHQAPPPRAGVPAKVGGDSDGDNDGSKGGKIDLRA